MFHNFILDEFTKLQVELLEVIKDGFNGVGEVLQPGHNVHYAPCPDSLGELVVPAHHLLKLLVFIGVPLPKANRAHYVGRGHHAVRHGLEEFFFLRFSQKQPQQLFPLAEHVTFKRLLSVGVPCGKHPDSGLGHFAVHLPPVRGGAKRKAVPIGDVFEGGEVRSAGEFGALFDQRLFN